MGDFERFWEILGDLGDLVDLVDLGDLGDLGDFADLGDLVGLGNLGDLGDLRFGFGQSVSESVITITSWDAGASKNWILKEYTYYI